VHGGAWGQIFDIDKVGRFFKKKVFYEWGGKNEKREIQ